MSKTQNIKIIGLVTQIHVNAQFSVKVEKIEKPLICYLAGKISRGQSKPTVGDRVELEIYPQDYTKGRIVRVLK
jgi:translation initiation factor IF-1